MTVGGLFYEGKSNITIIAAGLWSDRTFSSDTGIFALSVWIWRRDGGGRDHYYLCGILPGRRFYGGKDHTERPIYMGDRYRAFLLCSAASGIFSGTGEMGYDLCPCVDYFFHVSWWRSHWWDAVVKAYKKML